MSEPKRILFLSEHADESRPFIQALRDHGFDVQALSSVDLAITEIGHKRPYDLLIWTMWLEPGERIGALGVEKHAGGMKTGECFVEIVRRYYPTLPMLLFTRYQGMVRRYSRPNEAHYAWNLSSSGPRVFALAIARLLRGPIRSVG